MSKFDRKTSSGHTAGMHTGSSFGESERSLKRERDMELAQMDQGAAGRNAETIYRDKKGRKLDMLNEFMKQQSSSENKKQILEQAQYEWGGGIVQKKEHDNARKEMLEIANEPFARTIDNPKLEHIRKNTVREGDPMAQYFATKQEKIQEKQDEYENIQAEIRDKELQQSQQHNNNIYGPGGNIINKPISTKKKPLYKGPTPAPNRFGIKPGYRWDAVDRSNNQKFEHKLMLKLNEKTSLKDDAYKWSVSDL